MALSEKDFNNFNALDKTEKLKTKSVLSEKTQKNLNNNSETKVKIPSLLTADDVAQMLNVDRQRVYELTRQRKANGLPVIVLGERQYRYSRDAMLECIRDNGK